MATNVRLLKMTTKKLDLVSSFSLMFLSVFFSDAFFFLPLSPSLFPSFVLVFGCFFLFMFGIEFTYSDEHRTRLSRRCTMSGGIVNTMNMHISPNRQHERVRLYKHWKKILHGKLVRHRALFARASDE